MTQPIEQELVPYEAQQLLISGRVLILAPHPDDEVLGCGGAIMRHVQAGEPVHVVVVTDGAFGPSGDEVAYRLTREREARRAAEVLGYGDPCFWGLPDRGLEYGESLIGRVRECIEEFGAEVVYAPSWWEIHPDHSALALATAEAIRRSACTCTLAMYEVGSPLHPNRLLDITDLRGRKQDAIRCFESQIARQPYHEHIAALNRFRTYTLPATILAAEAYHVLTQEEIRSGPLRMIPPRNEVRRTMALRRRPEALVSVIIQTTRRSLPERTLDSIALQTYPHVEIVVVDTCPTNESGVPKWWGRFPLHVVSEDTGLTRSQAANHGLAASRGQFMAFLGEDDVIEPEHIAMLAACLGTSPDRRCAYSDVRIDHFVNGLITRSEILSKPFNKHQLMARDYISINSVLIDRCIYDAGCRFDESLGVAVEWDFLLQVSRLTEFIHVDRVTVRTTTSQTLGAGSGDDAEEPAPSASAAAVFEKWRSRWTGSQWAAILREQERLLADAAREVTELRSDLDASRRLLKQSEEQFQALAVRIAEPTETDGDAQVYEDGDETQDRPTQELVGTIDSLYRSTSWKVTAPMRSVSRWVRRVRGG
jgi:LmbE family N-acetylglucosaminyl deacetylase